MARAKTRDELDALSARDQVWEAVQNSTNSAIDKSNAAYDSSIAQAQRGLINRGMQRSSYGAQIFANMQNQKNKAANDLLTQGNTEYLNRLYQIGRDEKADDQWERQFAEGQRQFNENLGLQREQFGESKAQNEWNRNFQQSEADRAQRNTEWSQRFQQSESEREQRNTEWNQAFQQSEAEREQKNTAWNQAFQQSEAQREQENTEWNQAFQQSEAQRNQQNTEAQLAFQQSEAQREQRNTEWNQSFQQSEANRSQQNTEWEQRFQQQQADISREQWQKNFDLQREQWDKQFDYNKMSDEQKINYEYLMYSIQNGKNVSDAILDKAGLSREDFNNMTAQVAAGGGGGRGGRSGANSGDDIPEWQKQGYKSNDEYALALLNSFGTSKEVRDSILSSESGRDVIKQLPKPKKNN